MKSKKTTQNKCMLYKQYDHTHYTDKISNVCIFKIMCWRQYFKVWIKHNIKMEGGKIKISFKECTFVIPKHHGISDTIYEN